jgi:hypothetical protein
MTVATLLDRLDGVCARGAGRWSARCPAHPDRSPSLSVRELPDGRVLLHCFAGCGGVDILQAVGIGWSDLFPEPLERFKTPGASARMPAAWALEVLSREAIVVGIAAHDIAAGRVLSSIDADRVAQAAGRIASIAECVHGR